MKKIIYATLIAVIIITSWLLVSNNKPSNNQNKKTVSTSQKIINSGGQLIDVRTVEEYNEEHADDAVNIPLDNILAGNYNGIDKDKPLFLYCRSGNRSGQAKIALEKAGYKNITDLGALNSLKSEGMIVCKSNKSDCQATEEKQAEYLLYKNQATLKDITNSATFESIKFNGDASGTTYAEFQNGQYKLYADFKNLPILPDNLFYEGWIISSTSGVISSGELTLKNGSYINQFSDNRDLNDASQYVLTIEPRDGNPKPAAGHIVEGSFSKI